MTSPTNAHHNDLAGLIQTAIDARQKAYAPYSNFKVGAVLVAESGVIYTGCNVENAAYPATICAERTALVKAISEGDRRFDVMIVVTETAGTPCGVCRQMLYEFAPELRVVIADHQGNIRQDTTLRALLPDGFGPNDLSE